MRDFLAELKAIIHQHDERPSSLPPERLYNVHKRSLPVGIDKIIAVGFTKVEALRFVKTFKTKVERADNGSLGCTTYLEAVPEDATPDERSVFFNYGKAIRGAH